MPAYYDEKTKTYYAQFYYTNWKGEKKQKRKRGFERKKDAQAYEREFLRKENLSAAEMSFNSLMELYFDDMKNRLRETTIDNKKYLFDSKLVPFFGNMQIKDIQPATIRKWQNEIMEMDLAPTYIKTIHNQLSAILNYAVKYYGLPKNPCHIAGSIGKKKADEMLIWTNDEFDQFISVVKKPAMKLAYEIMYWSGLRVGETLALTKNDILPSRIIDVNKTVSRKEGEDRYYDPKTDKSCRQVPISRFLYNKIIEYTDSLYDLKDTDKIFYFTKSALNKNLTNYAKVAGVKKIRVHDLRHSHASLLIELGYNILVISERLGHESAETTLETYAHLYPNKQVALANELDDFFDKSKKVIDIDKLKPHKQA